MIFDYFSIVILQYDVLTTQIMSSIIIASIQEIEVNVSEILKMI